ncbi:MAG: glycine dehydrogenase, partial [Desulfotomaculaceae bacterium]|nr:glycine dehydrogenase [Desulfotomaculaceae bacterium]
MYPYLPITKVERKRMLEAVGAEDIDDLFADIPVAERCQKPFNLPGPLAEIELVRYMRGLAGKNLNTECYACFLGAGAYDHYIPGLVGQMLARQEFYTAYTPYQPEISQGTLQAIFEYQTMICELTGMEVSNASVYDGASAMAEAVSMACSATKRREVLLARTVHPEGREVVKTYYRFNGAELIELGYLNGLTDWQEAAD